MIPESSNLFNSLFEFRPRDGRTSKENFLSESFAHILKTVNGASEIWISKILQRKIQLAPDFEILTRNSEIDPNENSTVFPDLKIKATTISHEKIFIFAEHKWDAPCDHEQLKTYAEIAKQNIGTLIFVGKTFEQINSAKKILPNMHCFFWEDVYIKLAEISPRTELLNQFLDFMKNQGLSPGEPLTVERINAFVIATGFEEQLKRYANELNSDFDWTFLPIRFLQERRVTNRWGRVAIEFATPNWSPTITIGFLHSTYDHGVEFTQRNLGIDVLLRIEANPSINPNPQIALGALRAKADALRKLDIHVLTKGDSGNNNNHTLLIAQKNLVSIIEGKSTEKDQLETIYKQFKSWGEILFSDGKLEEALQTIIL